MIASQTKVPVTNDDVQSNERIRIHFGKFLIFFVPTQIRQIVRDSARVLQA
jgi:hypothetical protein